ncbi:MAG: carbohydrate kinase family protein [Candidatus Asgardarchaeia archaeon]
MDVVCVGNANLDMVFNVKKRAADDEKVDVDEFFECFGGSSANTAVALSRLGWKVGYVCCVGNDDVGSSFLRELNIEGVDTSRAKVLDDKRTGFNIILNFLGGEHTIYSYRGANEYLYDVDFDLDYLNGAKVVYLSSIDYRTFRKFVGMSRSKNLRTKMAMAPGHRVLSIGYKKLMEDLNLLDILFMNRREFLIFTGAKPTVTNIKEFLGCFEGCAVVTLGGDGAVALEFGEFSKVDAFKVKVEDPTGAGDGFSAGFIHAYIKGMDLHDRLFLGSAVSALQIQKKGARNGLPNREELKKFLEEKGFKSFDL